MKRALAITKRMPAKNKQMPGDDVLGNLMSFVVERRASATVYLAVCRFVRRMAVMVDA